MKPILQKSLEVLVVCAIFFACAGPNRKPPEAADASSVKGDTSMPALLAGDDNMKYGYPGGGGIVLGKQFYVILFDTTTLVAEWVTYHLTKEDLQGKANRADNFRPDPDLPEGKRSGAI